MQDEIASFARVALGLDPETERELLYLVRPPNKFWDGRDLVSLAFLTALLLILHVQWMPGKRSCNSCSVFTSQNV